MADSWEEYYGFKTEPFRGRVTDQSGNVVDITKPTGQHGIGFGPGDLRKARLEGWSALSILDYLKGPAGSGGFGTTESSQWYADTGGRGVVDQTIINELRQDQALQNRMKTGWEKMKETQNTTSQSVTEATQTAQQALAEAQKIKSPFAVTNNSAMQIAGSQSPSQAAGTISAGLAGLSRNKKFKNTSVNIK